ncbi:hypothetical protein DIPPA_04917 [Diplonema papillatum]|nr:hypothetical protein DIPPA_04917 [Diplonema papillatum]
MQTHPPPDKAAVLDAIRCLVSAADSAGAVQAAHFLERVFDGANTWVLVQELLQEPDPAVRQYAAISARHKIKKSKWSLDDVARERLLTALLDLSMRETSQPVISQLESACAALICAPLESRCKQPRSFSLASTVERVVSLLITSGERSSQTRGIDLLSVIAEELEGVELTIDEALQADDADRAAAIVFKVCASLLEASAVSSERALRCYARWVPLSSCNKLSGNDSASLLREAARLMHGEGDSPEECAAHKTLRATAERMRSEWETTKEETFATGLKEFLSSVLATLIRRSVPPEFGVDVEVLHTASLLASAVIGPVLSADRNSQASPSLCSLMDLLTFHTNTTDPLAHQRTVLLSGSVSSVYSAFSSRYHTVENTVEAHLAATAPFWKALHSSLARLPHANSPDTNGCRDSVARAVRPFVAKLIDLIVFPRFELHNSGEGGQLWGRGLEVREGAWRDVAKEVCAIVGAREYITVVFELLTSALSSNEWNAVEAPLHALSAVDRLASGDLWTEIAPHLLATVQRLPNQVLARTAMIACLPRLSNYLRVACLEFLAGPGQDPSNAALPGPQDPVGLLTDVLRMISHVLLTDASAIGQLAPYCFRTSTTACLRLCTGCRDVIAEVRGEPLNALLECFVSGSRLSLPRDDLFSLAEAVGIVSWCLPPEGIKEAARSVVQPLIQRTLGGSPTAGSSFVALSALAQTAADTLRTAPLEGTHAPQQLSALTEAWAALWHPLFVSLLQNFPLSSGATQAACECAQAVLRVAGQRLTDGEMKELLDHLTTLLSSSPHSCYLGVLERLCEAVAVDASTIELIYGTLSSASSSACVGLQRAGEPAFADSELAEGLFSLFEVACRRTVQQGGRRRKSVLAPVLKERLGGDIASTVAAALASEDVLSVKVLEKALDALIAVIGVTGNAEGLLAKGPVVVLGLVTAAAKKPSECLPNAARAFSAMRGLSPDFHAWVTAALGTVAHLTDENKATFAGILSNGKQPSVSALEAMEYLHRTAHSRSSFL